MKKAMREVDLLASEGGGEGGGEGGKGCGGSLTSQ